MLQGEKCVIWNYDVFGFEGGRTRQLCDTLAEKRNFFHDFVFMKFVTMIFSLQATW